MTELPSDQPKRRLLHTRHIVCSGYARSDGLFDIEGRMQDTKAHHANLIYKEVAAGGAIHDMRIVVTIDAKLVIRRIEARTEAAPTPSCAEIGAAYASLVGLTIGAGFMKQVKERLGGRKGCTHLSELLGPIATTAIQTMVNMPDELRSGAGASGVPTPGPAMIDTCHAWRSGGDVVRMMSSTGLRRVIP
jgi:Protein of unknown function (DUF2889)